MIDFPTSNRHLYDPNAEGYQAPWQDDVTGKEWTWSETKQRWEPYLSTATSFAELTDKASADLPSINGPLAAALDGKQPTGSYAPATGIAPSAITGTAVVGNDSRLSDERVPTAAGIAAKTDAATAATPNDADLLPVAESSSVLKKITFANLWAYIKGKLDGVLTIAGAKTFSGQMELTGQSATNDTSAMTRALGDARYGEAVGSYLLSNSPAINNSITLAATGLSITLTPGVWLVEVQAHIYNTATAAGGRMGVHVASGSATTGRGVRGIANVVDDRRSSPNWASEYSTTTAIASDGNLFGKGIVSVTATAEIQLHFAQGVAQASDSYLQPNSYMVAHKIA